MGQEITADQIQQYLDSRDDFDLELFAYRTLRERGWVVHLGGRYVDPIAGKPRQYDVRARFGFTHRRDLSLAVECKSLSPEFPLVVSRVPRPEVDSYHDVVKRWRRDEIGDTAFSIERSDPRHPHLYGEGQMVGKAATQIRWNESAKKFVASDAETYDKWSQAFGSAAELLDLAARQPSDDANPTFTFVMPVLLVNDGTLWVVDYTEEGARSSPTPADEAQLFVDYNHQVQGRYEKHTFHLSHLHIYTRRGFVTVLKNYASPTGMMLERTFGFALRH
jgi:hypothetical protein